MASLASKSPTNENGTPKRKKVVGQEKKIADDEFMAAAIGDVEWLRQSMKANRGAVTFDKNGLAPIHIAAIHGRVDCLRLLVEKFKMDVDLGSTTGWRPAHLCISNQTGKRAYLSLAYLLEKNANPSIANDDGITPMHQAASEGHVQCLKALIEAGGNVTGLDRRGHTPIDLAKLWGHRKCARMLAAERWQQEKLFVANEINHLQKLQMQQVLDDINQEEENKANQAFYGEQAFDDWLNTRGLDKANTGPLKQRQPITSQKKQKQTKDQELEAQKKPQESLHKANSMRRPIVPVSYSPIKEEPEYPRKGASSVTDGSRTPFTQRTNENIKDQLKVEMTEEQKELETNKDSKRELWYNPETWNKSTKLNEKEYIINLPDHYPHDEFTMKPKFAPTRSDFDKARQPGRLPHNSRMPQLPKDVIERKLHPAKYERPVVYKCKHIADIHMKHHYDNEALPRQEAGLHLTDDLESFVFKAALQRKTASSSSKVQSMEIPAALRGTRSGGVTMEKVDPGVVNIFKRMQKPTTYPHISGPEYDVV